MRLFIILFLVLSCIQLNSQQNLPPGEYLRLLSGSLPDSTRTNYLGRLSELYILSKPDSAMLLAQQALDLARKNMLIDQEIFGLNTMAYIFSNTGNPERSLQSLLEALSIAEKDKNPRLIGLTTSNIGKFYGENGEPEKAIPYSRKAFEIATKLGVENSVSDLCFSLGLAYAELNQLDSAEFYVNKAYQICLSIKDEFMLPYIYNYWGNTRLKNNKFEEALKYFHEGLNGARKTKNQLIELEITSNLAGLHEQTGNTDSVLFYARRSLLLAQHLASPKELKNASELLVNYFKNTSQKDSTLKYTTLLMSAKDSLYNREKFKKLKDIEFNEQIRQQEIEAQNIELKNRIRFYALIAIITVFMILLLILLRNIKLKQRSNRLLVQQKNEIEVQRDQIHKALTELKITQAQLIQSEKMASLGELTAGIAHEIQNPLNFVNNFADVNSELIAEMKYELDNGKLEDAKVIANNIDENEQKIIFHGKRADAIVKGMLQHSRSSSGVKEPTDINALTDEYLRLAYHGLRAKDKTFNAVMKTDFDQSIGLVNIIPQDIGRVILNLITNAFYAVSEKKKDLAIIPYSPMLRPANTQPGATAQQPGGLDFEPIVLVSTKKQRPLPGGGGSTIEISVKDNGNGIPQNVVDKIFQPFFTTKPTGQGTGLGLSISYDIIKAHGGEMKVNTKEGEGTEFIISLPI